MKRKKRDPTGPKWAYAYEIVPPQAADRLASIKALLDREAASAKLKSQTWQARLVRESDVSHILIVSDTPDQGREVNRRIEAELAALDADFSITVPMAVAGDGEPLPPADPPPGPDSIPPKK